MRAKTLLIHLRAPLRLIPSSRRRALKAAITALRCGWGTERRTVKRRP